MDIICYSHLRWNFVYQRPQHLLSRLVGHFRVFFIEEPMFDTDHSYLDNKQNNEKVWIIVPHLPSNLTTIQIKQEQEKLLKIFFDYVDIKRAIEWYYTPMGYNANNFIVPELIVYDCMDELSAFKNAPIELKQKEKDLLDKADVVFTGGYSLYEAKKNTHHNIHLFPSSIDKKHFEKARVISSEPLDQQQIPFPRIGFFGVIDERMDINLLGEIAIKRPDLNFIIIGPVVKINPNDLPKNSNIHYLGQKTYKELPLYLSGWNVAMMPFAINESTRYISPTKTPEYLAAGKPVVSTAVYDVVKTYGEPGLVYIAKNTDEFIEGIEYALNTKNKSHWLKEVDVLLANNSWDITFEKMMCQIYKALDGKKINKLIQKEDEYV